MSGAKSGQAWMSWSLWLWPAARRGWGVNAGAQVRGSVGGGWLEVKTQQPHSVGLGLYRHLWALPAPHSRAACLHCLYGPQMEADFSWVVYALCTKVKLKVTRWKQTGKLCSSATFSSKAPPGVSNTQQGQVPVRASSPFLPSLSHLVNSYSSFKTPVYLFWRLFLQHSHAENPSLLSAPSSSEHTSKIKCTHLSCY